MVWCAYEPIDYSAKQGQKNGTWPQVGLLSRTTILPSTLDSIPPSLFQQSSLLYILLQLLSLFSKNSLSRNPALPFFFLCNTAVGVDL